MPKLYGTEPFHRRGEPLGFHAIDFWRWAFSDLAGNSLRGLVAEFLVARALGLDDKPRVEWDAVDLRTEDGLRIEVKCSGYVQSWAQTKPSRISFDVAPKRGWAAAANATADAPARSADVYVFCVHAHRERDTLDPLDVSQWEFHVLPRHVLDARLGRQAVAALSTIRGLGAVTCTYDALGQTVRTVMAEPAAHK